MRKLARKRYLLVAIVIAAVGFSVTVVNGENKAGEDAVIDDVAVAEESQVGAIPVETMTVKTGNFSLNYNSYGRVRYNEEIDVVSQIHGRVDKVHVSRGDTVKKGDILFEVNSENTVNELTSQLETTLLELNQAENEYNYENEHYQVNLTLYNSGMLAKQDLEKSKLALEAKQKNYETLKTKHKQYTQAMLSNDDERLVKSPTDGVITQLSLKEGETTSSSGRVSIADNDSFIVEIPVSEKYVSKLNESIVGSVYIDALEQEFKCRVVNVSPTIDELNFTSLVGVRLAGDTSKLSDGMFAEVSLVLETFKDEVKVPKSSLIRDEDNYYIYILAGEKARKENVEVGITEGDEIQVIAGLKAGEIIITKGQNYITESSTLDVKSSDSDQEEPSS